MTLRAKLTLRYGAIIGVCLVLLTGLAYHEFVTEPTQRRAMGIPELPKTIWGEYVELFIYGMIPVVLGAGWWFVRRTLAPLHALALRVERIHPDNLGEPLSRSGSGDEVDRLTDAFNAMTARLSESFQQIRTFTLHASHELKTPLTIMRAQLETMLEDEKGLQPAQVEWLECELQEVLRLGKIVDSLTLLTKADAGLVKLERQPVPLEVVVQECFEDAKILAEPQGVGVMLSACEPVEVRGDRDRLRQLLLNLTDNAIKYNRPGGWATLALRRLDGAAQLEIANSGEGVQPEMLERVFDRFVRGSEARSRAIEGSGLGLSICRWIVIAHGGTLKMTSQPGQSTTVTVWLPLPHPS